MAADPAQPLSTTDNRLSASFAKSAKDFREYYARADNKPSEIDSQKRIVDRQLLAFFADVVISGVNLWSIESPKARKSVQGLSGKTVKGHSAVVGKMLRVAEAWEAIADAHRVQLLRVAQHERECISFSEAQTLLDASDAGMWRAMMTSAVRTGL